MRYGISIPFEGIPFDEQREWFAELEDLGYTDLWSSEASSTDAFVPLALAGQLAPRARLGTAVVPAFTRGPALMAMSVATMAAAFPGRFAFGIGSSSDVIVERWNGVPFEEPYRKVRDLVRFLKIALSGVKVDMAFDTFTVRGFRLGVDPGEPPPILVGALRPGMLHLAGREADGAVINWLSAGDVAKVVQEVIGAGAAEAARVSMGEGRGRVDAGPGGSGGDPRGTKEIVCRIFVCPSEDSEAVRRFGRVLVNSYLNVSVYAAFHEWLGRGPLLEPMWEAWQAGDRRGAAEAIPDEVVDDLIVHGSPEECRRKIRAYVDNGVTVPVIGLLPLGVDGRQAVRDLSPAAAST